MQPPHSALLQPPLRTLLWAESAAAVYISSARKWRRSRTATKFQRQVFQLFFRQIATLTPPNATATNVAKNSKVFSVTVAGKTGEKIPSKHTRVSHT